jgi:hypothetical protein
MAQEVPEVFLLEAQLEEELEAERRRLADLRRRIRVMEIERDACLRRRQVVRAMGARVSPGSVALTFLLGLFLGRLGITVLTVAGAGGL